MRKGRGQSEEREGEGMKRRAKVEGGRGGKREEGEGRDGKGRGGRGRGEQRVSEGKQGDLFSV